MTTVATHPYDRSTGADAPAHRLTFARVLRSEWIKIATVRSTWWSIVVVAALSIGMSLLLAYAMTSAFGAEVEIGEISVDALSAVLGPTQLTILLAGVIGAIMVTGEYSTGMIRSTLTAETRRGSIVAAKAIVAAALLAVTSAVVFAVAALTTAPLLTHTPLVWSDPALSIVPIGYGVLSMAAFALIGLSFGFIIGNGAGAIGATVALLFLLPPLLSIIPTGGAWQWIRDLGNTLPGPASEALMTPGSEVGLSDGLALLSLAVWVVAGLVASWVVLRWRDA